MDPVKLLAIALATLLAATGLPGGGIAQDTCTPGTPDPTGATAHGTAAALLLVDPALNINLEESAVESSQSGVGTTRDADVQLTLADLVPPNDVELNVLAATAESRVVADPALAGQLSFAEVANLSLLDGLVRADFIRAVASAQATGDSAVASRAGSTIVGLEVNGYVVSDHAPNTRIWLPSALFGKSSYVVINEQVLGGVRPAYKQFSGGHYLASIEVTAIHVHLTDADLLTLGNQGLDLRIATAKAVADFPQPDICPPVFIKYVAASGWVARFEPPPGTLPVTFVGGAGIRSSGGHDEQHLVDLTVPENSPYLLADTAASMADGVLGDVVTADAFADIAGLCTQPVPSCYLKADVVRADAHADATRLEDGTFILNAAGSTTLVGVHISSLDVCLTLALQDTCTPEPNTVIELPGVGFVVLNEQIPDAPSLGHAGIMVRAIRLVVTTGMPANEPLELIVSQARAGATYDP